MNVRWSPLAIERVIEIGEWIASEQPAAAARIVESLFDATKRLETFPLSGRHVPEFEDRNDLREIVVQQFRVVYKATETHIEILTVRHTLQKMDAAILGE